MALQKAVTLENGVEMAAAYIKFGPLSIHQTVSITDDGREAKAVGRVDLLVYADAGARKAGKPAALLIEEAPPQHVRIAVIAAPDRAAALALLYGWVKTLDRFAGAADV